MKTARTSPRARKHTRSAQKPVSCAQALCWRPMAVPRRPHQPRAPRTTRASRISTHAATRAPQHTSPALPRLFAPCAGSAHCFWHLTSGCTRTRREYDADSAPRKARTHARTRTRAHPLSLLHSLSACLHTQHASPPHACGCAECSHSKTFYVEVCAVPGASKQELSPPPLTHLGYSQTA